MISAVSTTTNALATSSMQRRSAVGADASEATSVATSKQVSASHGGPPKAALDATAKLLGMTTDELSSALQGGAKLKDLADSKGVSQSDLVASVVEDLKAGAPSGAPALSDQMLTSVARHIVSGEPPRGGGPGGGEGGARSFGASGMSGPTGARGHGRPPSGPPPAATKSAASLLDMSESELLKEFEKGTSLTDLASSKNVSSKDLLAVITEALEPAAADEGATGSGLSRAAGSVYGGSMSGMFADAFA